MSGKTVAALFDRFEDARDAANNLVRMGTDKDKVALLANSADKHHPDLLSNPAFAKSDFEKPESDATSGLGVGVELGAGVGGLLGLLLATGTIAIPGIGPVIAAGAWISVAAGLGAGAVVGGAIGILTDHGVSQADAHLYAEGLRRGGTLVSVHVDADQVDRIMAFFKTAGAVDIEKRGADWHADGWISFDHEVPPLPAADVRTLGGRPDLTGYGFPAARE